MSEIPDRANIDKSDRELYDKVVEGKDGFFKGTNRKEQFFMTMAFGFANNVRKPLNTKFAFFNTRELDSKDIALINAVFLHTAKDLEGLTDGKEVLKVAEEYAHAGIRLLIDRINSTSFGDFWKRFEKDLNDKYLSR